MHLETKGLLPKPPRFQVNYIPLICHLIVSKWIHHQINGMLVASFKFGQHWLVLKSNAWGFEPVSNSEILWINNYVCMVYCSHLPHGSWLGDWRQFTIKNGKIFWVNNYRQYIPLNQWCILLLISGADLG